MSELDTKSFPWPLEEILNLYETRRKTHIDARPHETKMLHAYKFIFSGGGGPVFPAEYQMGSKAGLVEE